MAHHCGFPFSLPKTIVDLMHLESVFDVMDLYLWFSYRFQDIFPEAPIVRETQKELDEIIQQGVFQITRLLKNSEGSNASSASANTDEDPYINNLNRRSTTHFRGNCF